MADEDDIVQNVRIEAIDEASGKIKAVADEATAAMRKATTEAEKQAKANEDAAAALLANAAAAKKLAEDLDAAASRGKGLIGTNKQIGDSARTMASGFSTAAKSFATFAKRVVATGTAVTAAVTGTVIGLRNLSKAYSGVDDSAARSAAAQTENIKAGIEANTSARAYERSLSNLHRQLAAGEMDYTQYAKAVADTQREYRENAREAFAAAEAQRYLARETERLNKIAASQKVFDALADKVGGPLAQSMLTAGKAADSFYNTVRDKLSGPLANIMDRVVALVEKNGSAIQGFFDRIAASISSFANDGGVERTFASIVSAATQVGTVITSVIVPALQSMYAALQSMATVINAVFGTQLTGGGLAAIIVIAGLTKSFTFLGGVLKGVYGAGLLVFHLMARIPRVVQTLALAFRVASLAVGPIGIAIAAIAGAVIYLATQTRFFQNIWARMTALGSNSANSLQSAWASFSGFFTGIWAGIQARATAVWGAVTSAATSARDAVQAVWEGVVGYFAGIWSQITMAANFVWGAIVARATAAWESIKTAAANGIAVIQAAWGGFVQLVNNGLTLITSTATAVWNGLSEGLNAAIAYVQERFAAFSEFVSGWVSAATAFFVGLGNSIKTAFSSAIEAVKGYFTSLYQQVMSVLNPIIETIKSIIALAGSIAGGGSSKAPGYAGGGHVTGPGTGTSDSILARLSNGEFVIKARRVRELGVNFLRMLNSGRLDPSRWLPGFADGGLVGGQVGLPRMGSTGGRARGATDTLNLTIDGQTFNGLQAPRSVSRELRTFAMKRNVLRAGRAPGWVGG